GGAGGGWLTGALARRETAGNAKPRNAFAVGPIAPLVVRGQSPVLSWTPPRLPPASDDTMMRLLDLYRHTDPALPRVLEERLVLAAIARAGRTDGQDGHYGQPRPGGRPAARLGGSDRARLRRKIHGAGGRPPRRRARLRRLGYPRQRGRARWPAGGTARRARRGDCRDRDQHGRGLARERGCCHHRI